MRRPESRRSQRYKAEVEGDAPIAQALAHCFDGGLRRIDAIVEGHLHRRVAELRRVQPA
jgi:hypothetical protein